MKLFKIILMTATFNLALINYANAETVEDLINFYTAKGAVTPNGLQGKQLWQKTFQGKGQFAERSCVSCHKDDLSVSGKHIKTQKLIKPMAPSANPQRLTSLCGGRSCIASRL